MNQEIGNAEKYDDRNFIKNSEDVSVILIFGTVEGIKNVFLRRIANKNETAEKCFCFSKPLIFPFKR